MDSPNGSAAMQDLRLQDFNITGPGGEPMTLNMGFVDKMNRDAAAICINYGSQAGASIMMLLVVLAMNPTAKLLRVHTGLQVAALAANVIRMVLLSLFWTSEWVMFYTQYTGDTRYVTRSDFATSVASSVLSLVVNILFEACLILQAWTMVNLWSKLWKWAAVAGSALVSLTTIGFRFAFCILQNKAVFELTPGIIWVASASVITGAISIFWYCALFNVQLISHLIKNRTFLPNTSSLTPMEALAVSNGILMVVPVVFASLQWLRSSNFEAGSLTYTSVVVILPLGTLVAHRLTALRSYKLSAGSESGWDSKPSAIHESITSSNPRSRLMTRIEAPVSGPNYDELEFQDHGHGLGGRSGVRVHRDVDQTVEHTPREF